MHKPRKTKAKKNPGLLRAPSFCIKAEDDNELQGKCAQAIEKARERFGPELGQGNHRICFRLSPVEVIKIPLKESGFFANSLEANTCGGLFARCEFDDDIGKELGVPVLRMEYVEHVGWSKEPDWTWGIDCGQVGRTADGRLVAYDWDNY